MGMWAARYCRTCRVSKGCTSCAASTSCGYLRRRCTPLDSPLAPSAFCPALFVEFDSPQTLFHLFLTRLSSERRRRGLGACRSRPECMAISPLAAHRVDDDCSRVSNRLVVLHTADSSFPLFCAALLIPAAAHLLPAMSGTLVLREGRRLLCFSARAPCRLATLV